MIYEPEARENHQRSACSPQFSRLPSAGSSRNWLIEPLEGSVVGVALELIGRDPGLGKTRRPLLVEGSLHHELVERLAAEPDLAVAHSGLLVRDHGRSLVGAANLAHELGDLDPQRLRLSQGTDGIEQARQTTQTIAGLPGFGPR